MAIKKILITLIISMQINGNYVGLAYQCVIDYKCSESSFLPIDKNVRIAIIDTGVNIQNPIFQKINITNIDISNKSTKPNYYHGTIVTGIIVDNIRSTSPDILPKVELFSIIMGKGDVLEESGLIRAIEKAISLNVDVINISACIYTPSDHLKKAVDKALSKNILIVASVGNDCYSGYSYPASYDGVIAVTSIDENGLIFNMANKNDQISVCAPGVDIETDDPDNTGNLKKITGTSAAAPFVTALVSIIKYHNKNITNKQLKDLIEDTAIDLGDAGKDNTYGYGLINYKDALEKSGCLK